MIKRASERTEFYQRLVMVGVMRTAHSQGLLVEMRRTCFRDGNRFGPVHYYGHRNIIITLTYVETAIRMTPRVINVADSSPSHFARQWRRVIMNDDPWAYLCGGEQRQCSATDYGQTVHGGG